MTVKEIANNTGISFSSLLNYLKYWHRDVIISRKGLAVEEADTKVDLMRIPRKNPWTVEK